VNRLYVVVEGQTEESFIANVLAPVLWNSNIDPIPILLGPPGHRGGRTSYARVKRDVLVLLKQDRGAYCSTMVDLYGLGPDFPGTPPPAHLSNLAKVQHIEAAVKRDVCDDIPDYRPDIRFIPYLQLHEYESLLFSDPAAFANGINQDQLADHFRAIRGEFDSPEDINDDPNTSPSKRVLAACPTYRKVIEGTLAASSVGIPTIRAECLHFREWLDTLEALEGL
jgi:Domain of unknown function (DUF4276)